MLKKTNLTQEEAAAELAYAEKTTELILEALEKYSERKSGEADRLVEDRAYFIDSFRELHKDEIQDWLQYEHREIQDYDKSAQTINRLLKQLAEPYFGKVSYTGRGDRSVYFGIYELADEKHNKIVVDWRAPVSGLYYDCEPGPAEYTAPAGKIKVNLTQKRRFGFEKRQLAVAQNIKMPSDDDFLTDILSEGSSDHLKVIVSSLQKNQNAIVRDRIDGVYIISGCAGSGKSSVAMHKIAYILYNYRDRINNQDVVVLSPNKYFSEYISNILPDLGEKNVYSLTQEELVKNLLVTRDVEFLDRDASMERMLGDSGSEISDAVKFKNSRIFAELLKRYVKYFEATCFKARNLEYNEDGNDTFENTRSVKAADIDYLFYDNFIHNSILDRIELIADYVCAKNHYSQDEVRAQIVRRLKEMMTELEFGEIYRKMFTDGEFFAQLPEEIRQAAGDISVYKPGQLVWEDAVAVAYIISVLSGYSSNTNAFYLFADEAQDLSPVMLEILKNHYPKANFLFAGDLNQNVFANGEDYTENIKNMFKGKFFKKYELNVNYRSTKQISEFAVSRSGHTNELSAVREGDEPCVLKVGKQGVKAACEEWLKTAADKGYARCLVVGATNAEVSAVSSTINLPENFGGGQVSFMPIYQAKGLEYDAVLVLNTDGEMEKLDSKLGTNMFYTSATRAMHSLTVLE